MEANYMALLQAFQDFFYTFNDKLCGEGTESATSVRLGL
jgi:hypothetical protein